MTDEKDFLKGTCPINPDDLDSCEACQQGYGVLQYKSTFSTHLIDRLVI